MGKSGKVKRNIANNQVNIEGNSLTTENFFKMNQNGQLITSPTPNLNVPINSTPPLITVSKADSTANGSLQ